MNWFAYALIAAALWGGSYVIYEQLLKTISPASSMLYSALGTVFVYLVWAMTQGTLARDWHTIKKGGSETNLILAVILVNALANLAILFSMKEKNATVAGLIEITYPLFAALFAWMFLKQTELSWGTTLGGFLILSGAACIYYFERTA